MAVEQGNIRADIPSVTATGASALFSAANGAAMPNPAATTPATTALENFISTATQITLLVRPGKCVPAKSNEEQASYRGYGQASNFRVSRSKRNSILDV